MKVCDLPRGRELHADMDGNPFVVYPPSGLRPAGWCAEVMPYVDFADRNAVEAWERQPDNDCLRARGDQRWQAACAFTARRCWLDTLPQTFRAIQEEI